MGVRYEWDDERHIIINVYLEKPWTWQEYHAMIAEYPAMIGSSDRPYATAVDCRSMGPIPKDGNLLNILMSSERSIPHNNFASVIVAAPYIVSMLINTVTKVRPNPQLLIAFTSMMEEAHEKIYARYAERFPELANARRKE